MNRKRLLIITGLVLTCIVMLPVVILGNNRNSSDETNSNESDALITDSDRTAYVSGVSNLDLDETFGITDDIVVNQTVYGFLYAQTRDIKPSYQANVRDDSYKLTETDSGTTAQFLVDVPELQRTVRVEINSDSISNRTGIYVFCPTADELVYKPIACTEIDQ